MLKRYLPILFVFVLCTNISVGDDYVSIIDNIPGSDRDVHGCIGSAGYTWCESKQKCLRHWEEDCPPVGQSPYKPLASTEQITTHFLGSDYQVITEKMTWNDAKNYAESLGGHLVTISDENENRYVIDLARSKGVTDEAFWMGFTDEKNEGDFRWITGEPVTYTNWYPGNPNNDVNQDYGTMGWGSPYSWDDDWGTRTRPFVVEFESDYELDLVGDCYKLDEYGVIQQVYDEEVALVKASPLQAEIVQAPSEPWPGYDPHPNGPYFPSNPVPGVCYFREPYIDLIPCNSATGGPKLELVSIVVTPGEITVYSPQDNAVLSPDKSVLSWYEVTISDDYDPELFYEAEIMRPQELSVNVTEFKAEIKNIVSYPVYNIVVAYPSENNGQLYWRYGILDELDENEENTILLKNNLVADDALADLYDYWIPALDDAGLTRTQMRNNWIEEWLCKWLCINDSTSVQSFVIYRIPDYMYGQYLQCSVYPEPTEGMNRVGIVELVGVPIRDNRYSTSFT